MLMFLNQTIKIEIYNHYSFFKDKNQTQAYKNKLK